MGHFLVNTEELMNSSRLAIHEPQVVAEHGADALRLYLMFMGPLEAAKPWQSRQIMGVVRFMGKVAAVCGRAAGRKRQGGGAEQGVPAAAAAVAALSAEEAASVASCRSLLHRTIRKVGGDYEALAFNTALSALMVLTTTGCNTPPERPGVTVSPKPALTTEGLSVEVTEESDNLSFIYFDA